MSDDIPKTVTYKIRATFLEPVLGTAPANKEVYTNFIASKKAAAEEIRRKAAERTGAPTEPVVGTEVEELETISETAGLTVFHSDYGQPGGKGLFFYNYLIKGFFKEAAEALVPVHGVKQPRSKLDNLLFVYPRRIYLTDEIGGLLTKADAKFERPLRAMTMQGPRISLACSEMVNAGRVIDFEIKMYDFLQKGFGKEAKKVDPDSFLRMILDYGRDKGFGQWRSASFGSFTYEILK